MSKEGPPVELDGILKKLGQFGKFNLLNYGLMFIPIYLSGMYSSVFVFEASDISYRCKVSECERHNYSGWIANALPFSKGEPVKCARYAASNTSGVDACSADAFDAAVHLKCEDIVYSDEDSAVKDFHLGCQDWKRTLIGTIRNSGLFICMPLTGLISDRFGRKTALILASLMSGVFGFARSFSVNYMMMLIMGFLESALGAGINSSAFVLAMELVSPKGRALGSFVLYMVFTFGLMSLPLCVWWLHDWRHLLRVIYSPAILALPSLWFLSESVRWLLSKGRNEEAGIVLKRAAKMNNADVGEELKPLFRIKLKCETGEREKLDLRADDQKKSMLKVFQSRVLVARVFVCSLLWVTCTFVYNGLGINSVSLDGNRFINFSLVAFMDIPANIVYLLVLDRFGRKKTLAAFFILSAAFCISLWSMPKDTKWLSLLIYLCGKLSIAVAYNVLYIYVSEVFPTSGRQSLFSVCSSLGRIGSILAPMTPLLANYSDNLAAMCFGSLALVASGIVLILPETLDMPLPDTVEDAEQLAKGDRK